ncbi:MULTISPECIES: MarR family winged helix-turn-helix transcriptional regulator [Zobellia]|uniref:MarR family winged helix-turn-helix transcriptional regulator n=1 Tax=Zobellia TaxID=112040 RepID=UPI001BFFB66C|nr:MULTISPECIES: MarR family transcriptional regulator [Zobellia]MBT9188421.1 MarR family transcriptional regulator [Zobellia russellii]MBU2976369.1 MarR family transcriptional regulator [Zobellia sp. B3R18]MDO6819363.1 MarR family transcriptional regulator [Zobellia sp. 1_MG-2023]
MKDITIDYALRATWQAVARMYNEEAKKFDSTMAVGFTLLSVDPKTGTPSTALGPKMGMEATSLSRILKRMEEQGLIERKPNPNDGRGVLIYLTEFGLEKRNDSKNVVLRFNETVRNHVSEEKINGFFEVMETINELIAEKTIYTNDNLINGQDTLGPETD